MPCAYDAVAVVIPAQNERAKLPACLRAVLTAALCAPIPAGHHIHHDTDLSVITLKRIQARDPYGFADYLTQLGRTAAGDCA